MIGSGECQDRSTSDEMIFATVSPAIVRRGRLAMDDERFDRIARSLATAPSRRNVLRLMVGASTLAGGGLLSRLPAPTAAHVTTADAQCDAGPVIDHRRCRVNTCRNRADCACVRTTGGKQVCVELLFEESFCKRRQCRGNRDCPRGELCIEVGGCCEGRRKPTICVSPCG
jgi:hypothetical protein